MNRILQYALTICLSIVFVAMEAEAQIAINTDGSSADPSAVLDIKSTDKGFGLPRMTLAQRTSLAVTATQESLTVYQTDSSPTAPAGIYRVSANGNWFLVNNRQTYRSTIVQGAVPTIVEGQMPGTVLGTINTGVTRVDIVPPPGLNAVVLATPESDAAGSGTPPNPASGDYCINSFSGNCNSPGNRHHNTGIYISQPANSFAGWTGTPSLNFFMTHCPTAASCNTANGDYQIHPVSPLANPCFGFFGQANSYDGNFSGGGYTGVDLLNLTTGSQFDLTLIGTGSASFSTAIAVFIDWNQDGDYYDIVGGFPENVVNTPYRTWPPPPFGGSYSNANATSSTGNVWQIDVPANAINGWTWMRVVSSPFSASGNPCLVHSAGSTRDYNFRVGGGLPFVGSPETAVCSVNNQDASGFEVRCYRSKNGAPYDARFHLLVNPQ